MRRSSAIFLIAALPFLNCNPANAMDPGGYGEFQKLLQLPPDSLTEKAKSLFFKKFPASSGKSSDPDHEEPCSKEFDFSNVAVNIAYCIAEQKTELLAGYQCYNPVCGRLGFRNLAECFLNKGNKGDFSLHAFSMDTCINEAILIFLLDDMAAPDAEIDDALRFLFDPSMNEPMHIYP